MGPTTFALCQKAGIGVAMWITGLCSFPPLIKDVAMPLDAAGASVKAPFSAPVDKSYQFILSFDFKSVEARLQDSIVGRNFREECYTAPATLIGQSEYGRPIPIKVVVRRANDQSVVIEKEFTSLCVLSHGGNRKSRNVGWVTLSRGEYIVEMTNVVAQEGLADTKTYIALVPGGGK